MESCQPIKRLKDKKKKKKKKKKIGHIFDVQVIVHRDKFL